LHRYSMDESMDESDMEGGGRYGAVDQSFFDP
jgi:hypothetical protein